MNNQQLNRAAHKVRQLLNSRRVNLITVLLALANLVFMAAPVSADIVPNDAALASGDWSEFTVALNLSGYSSSAVSFNFSDLMRQNADGFNLSSAARVSYLDGFRLLSSVRSQLVQTSTAASSRASGQFEYSPGDRTYKSAMFNLAAYDGQSVILKVAVNARSVGARGGTVNLENLRIDVDAVPAAAAAPIPEPTSLTLAGAALLCLFGASRWSRARKLLPTS